MARRRRIRRALIFGAGCVELRYTFYTVYAFELDRAKSESNRKKHGIDFVGAQTIWQDPDFIEIQAKSVDEPRHLVVGMIGGKH